MKLIEADSHFLEQGRWQVSLLFYYDKKSELFISEFIQGCSISEQP
jgi:hypothetical protein